MDFLIVSGGVLDLWLFPFMNMMQSMILHQDSPPASKKMHTIMSIVRMMKLLRVLRLVRLFKQIKPLYSLLMGVIDSMRAMQWVLILTALILYAFAIVFTTIVGHGMINGGEDVSESEKEIFGTVSLSSFSLFKLMNGDTDVVEPICTTVVGKLMFAGFMVLSNWAILAILTSVVSDNMIKASRENEEEEERKQLEADTQHRKETMLKIFSDIDIDRNGYITEAEWRTLMEDKIKCPEICKATDLEDRDLEELFHCWIALTKETVLSYNGFVDHIKSNSKYADKGSVLLVMARLREFELHIDARFNELMVVNPATTTHITNV